MVEADDFLRRVMRHWTTGVAVVSSTWQGQRHGLTANSLSSVSVEPPLVTVTLANAARTHGVVKQSGVFGVTILSAEQEEVAARFAGRLGEWEDRFSGLEVFLLETGSPLLVGGLAHLDCRVVFEYPMPGSTLFVGWAVAFRVAEDGQPLVYHQRAYHRGCL